ALASASDRWAFLRSYLAWSGLRTGASRAAARIRQRSGKLCRRRKIREMRNDDSRRAMFVPSAGMHVHEHWVSAVQQAGLTSFDAVMSSTSLRLLRSLRDRDNAVVELPTAAGTVRAYLTRHRARY